jgi:hypothetical protein
MSVPKVQGVIRRRLLVNYRVDPEVMSRHLPAPFRPKLQGGYAIAGICLIRLEQIRPSGVPPALGLSSENAAHRIAVVRGSEDAVFIPRRDSDSWLNHMIGGRLFPGEHHRAQFLVEDDGCAIRLKMESLDKSVSVEVEGKVSRQLPAGSAFASVHEASRFFERGSLGYSPTGDPSRFDGLILATHGWSVEPLTVASVSSSYFSDRQAFPVGSVEFDHALVMRDLQHEWLSAPTLSREPGLEGAR